jgi:hypothetical protein
VGALAIEDLVRADLDQVDPVRRSGLGEDPDSIPVPSVGEARLAGTAVHVGPRRRVDDDFGPIAIKQIVDGYRRVEVEVGASPRDRTGRPGEWSVAERREQRSPQAPIRAGDGDAHQPADRNRDPYCRS